MVSTPRPLDQIASRIRGDMRREIPGTDATIWPNNLSIFAKVFAAAIHEIDLRTAWIYRQIFASTADGRHLERHAYEYGLARKPASRATGYIETISTAANRFYPAGISFLSDGVTFKTVAQARSDENGAIRFLVRSLTPGAASNRAGGEGLTLADVALYPALTNDITVAAEGLGGGAEAETDNLLRARVLDRKRRPPQGGAIGDYEQMALAVSGVTHAWAYSFASGPGTVGIWVLFDGRTNGIPTAADIATVQSAIDMKRLIRAESIVNAPVPVSVPITISLLAGDTESTRAAIEASLAAMFTERSRPGVAASPFRLSRSWIVEAISQAIGEDSHSLTAPAVDIIYSAGDMPVLGTITYV